MTRAMLATVLFRLAKPAGAQGAGGAGFGDVPAGRWYTDAVDWAASGGIVNGVGGGMFAPDADVTREQAAAIILRYAESAGKAQGAKAAGPTGAGFADAADISGWAAAGAAFCEANGIITGRPGGAFDPRGDATRAELAAVLQRFDRNILEAE
jgi:hypothetical protein